MAEYLFGVVDSVSPGYLLATNTEMECVSVTMKPGCGVVPAGTVCYRSGNGIYEPAATANIIAANYLVILRDTVDTDASLTVGLAVAAYRKGNFIKGRIKAAGNTALTTANMVAMRAQGLTLTAMDNFDEAVPNVTNKENVTVTVTNDGNGTGSASPASGTIGTVVTLSATPSSGYVFDKWEIVEGDITIGSDNKFTIGDKAPTVKATFKAE